MHRQALDYSYLRNAGHKHWLARVFPATTLKYEREHPGPMTGPMSEPDILIAANWPELLQQQVWQKWFAWHPVCLFMSGRYVWLRSVHRRCVRNFGLSFCAYTDEPDAFHRQARRKRTRLNDQRMQLVKSLRPSLAL